jgi:DNA ligase-1
MPEIEDGASVEVAGSGSNVYTLKNVGGVYSCTCPAWRHQSLGIEKRTCKHLRAYRGEEAELARVGAAVPAPRKVAAAAAGGASTGSGSSLAVKPPPVLLAHKWEGMDPTGWWMSEKLDGVRAYWNGKTFISRLGNAFLAPAWFTEGLPESPLDGELWYGRKLFQKTTSIVRRTDGSDEWKKLTYVVFDAPEDGRPFEKRLEFCRDWMECEEPPYARWHPHELCQGREHLLEELRKVEALGGEGLMLRKAGSRYEVGRSSTLLKVKTFHDDEARVVAHVAGAGRHEGRLGSLLCELRNGKRFNVGTGLSDHEREDPPPVGAIITYRFQELTDDGIPRFPSYVGVRDDVAWEPDKAASKAKPSSAVKPASEAKPAPAPAPAAKPGPAKPAPATKPAPARPAAAAERKPSSTAPAAAGADGKKLRYFELEDGSSSKFWEVTLDGTQQIVRFGKIGSPGQKRLKSFPSPGAAETDTRKLINEKTRKGYKEKSAP